MADRPNGTDGRPPEASVIADEIASRVPDFAELAAMAKYSQHLLAGVILSDGDTHESVRIIVNQAVNDFCDLLDELANGHGRPAIRTSRSLIEHAINLRTVADDAESAERYFRHLDLADVIVSGLEIGLVALEGKELQAERHRLRKIKRDVVPRFEQAVSDYGTAFRRGWHPQNVRDRAAKFASKDLLYKLYRLTSLMMHGAAGGSLGTRRESRGTGSVTFRTGPALELLPLAMFAGIVGYHAFLEALAIARSDMDVTAYGGPITGLLPLWGRYLTEVVRLDKTLWPTQDQPSPRSVLGIAQDGTEQWFLHLPWLDGVMKAQPPKRLTQATRDRLDHLKTSILAGTHGDSFASGRRFATIDVEGITVAPDPADVTLLPTNAILIDRSEIEPGDLTVYASVDDVGTARGITPEFMKTVSDLLDGQHS